MRAPGLGKPGAFIGAFRLRQFSGPAIAEVVFGEKPSAASNGKACGGEATAMQRKVSVAGSECAHTDKHQAYVWRRDW